MFFILRKKYENNIKNYTIYVAVQLFFVERTFPLPISFHAAPAGKEIGSGKAQGMAEP